MGDNKNVARKLAVDRCRRGHQKKRSEATGRWHCLVCVAANVKRWRAKAGRVRPAAPIVVVRRRPEDEPVREGPRMVPVDE